MKHEVLLLASPTASQELRATRKGIASPNCREEDQRASCCFDLGQSSHPLMWNHRSLDRVDLCYLPFSLFSLSPFSHCFLSSALASVTWRSLVSPRTDVKSSVLSEAVFNAPSHQHLRTDGMMKLRNYHGGKKTKSFTFTLENIEN